MGRTDMCSDIVTNAWARLVEAPVGLLVLEKTLNVHTADALHAVAFVTCALFSDIDQIIKEAEETDNLCPWKYPSLWALVSVTPKVAYSTLVTALLSFVYELIEIRKLSEATRKRMKILIDKLHDADTVNKMTWMILRDAVSIASPSYRRHIKTVNNWLTVSCIEKQTKDLALYNYRRLLKVKTGNRTDSGINILPTVLCAMSHPQGCSFLNTSDILYRVPHAMRRENERKLQMLHLLYTVGAESCPAPLKTLHS